MAECLVEVHAAEHEQHHFRSSEEDVDPPQQLGGVLNARLQAVGRGAGDFGLKQLHAADAQHGEDSQGQDDDPHAAQPMSQRPP